MRGWVPAGAVALIAVLSGSLLLATGWAPILTSHRDIPESYSLMRPGFVVSLPAASDSGASNTSNCGVGCYVPGVWTFDFNVSSTATLVGSFNASGPVEFVIASGAETHVTTCNYESLLCFNGTLERDPGLLYDCGSSCSNSTSPSLNLSAYSFGFGGNGTALPVDNWEFFLLNWGSSPVRLVVDQTVALR